MSITKDCFINEEFFCNRYLYSEISIIKPRTKKRVNSSPKATKEEKGDGKENIRVDDYAKNKVLIKDTSVVITKKEEFPKEGL